MAHGSQIQSAESCPGTAPILRYPPRNTHTRSTSPHLNLFGGQLSKGNPAYRAKAEAAQALGLRYCGRCRNALPPELFTRQALDGGPIKSPKGSRTPDFSVPAGQCRYCNDDTTPTALMPRPEKWRDPRALGQGSTMPSYSYGIPTGRPQPSV